MLMLDYNTTKDTSSILGQRRKSSPECLFRFKPIPVQQPQNTLKWLKPSTHRYSLIIPPSENKTRPLSFYSSSSLPAAPVLTGSGFSSLKKRERLVPKVHDLFKSPEMHTSATRTDIELATEIGQGLLSEVRRMQTLLSERQAELNQLTNEKQENQSRIHELVKQLRYKSESEEKLKQDLWDLELAKQDLNQHVQRLSATLQKAQLEQCKRDQQDSVVQQELEMLKQSKEYWQDVVQKTQNDYESKLKQLSESLLQISREKETIKQELEVLKNSNTERPVEKESVKDVIEELKVLQISLAQANHVVETLQLDLEKEKEKKHELNQLLAQSQETIENLQTMPYDMSVHPLTIAPDPQFRKALPFIMHTMMGEWMCKYTRYVSHHRRFFWLHPYTKTLYWSQQEPSLGGLNKAKSALIESFHVEEYSSHDLPIIVIKSSKRDIRIQCLAKESHDSWIQSLAYLLERRHVTTKSKRLSLLLENRPPDTLKKKWRMSLSNVQEKPRRLQKRPQSMIFGSLKL